MQGKRVLSEVNQLQRCANCELTYYKSPALSWPLSRLACVAATSSLCSTAVRSGQLRNVASFASPAGQCQPR
jgi:hypothetical protein